MGMCGAEFRESKDDEGQKRFFPFEKLGQGQEPAFLGEKTVGFGAFCGRDGGRLSGEDPEDELCREGSPFPKEEAPLFREYGLGGFREQSLQRE